MSIKKRFTSAEGDWFRMKQWRTLRAILLVGIVCAALLVLLVYWYYHRKVY